RTPPRTNNWESYMPTVLIAPATLTKVEGPFLHVLRNAGFNLIFNETGHQLNEDEIFTALNGVSASVAGSEPYTPRVLAAHPQLGAMAGVGVGYGAVDGAAATARGIAVAIAPNTNQDAVAEHTFCLMLGLVKNLVAQHLGTRALTWPRGANLPLRHRTLG